LQVLASGQLPGRVQNQRASSLRHGAVPVPAPEQLLVAHSG
jgi:hypothetical protein